VLAREALGKAERLPSTLESGKTQEARREAKREARKLQGYNVDPLASMQNLNLTLSEPGGGGGEGSSPFMLA
jgi:hypothetical protein